MASVTTQTYAEELVRLVRIDLALDPKRFGNARSWTDLHDVCDANEYLIDADEKFGERLLHAFGRDALTANEATEFCNAAIAIAEKALFGDGTTYTYLDELVIGEVVRAEFHGRDGTTTWHGTQSGTYIGVALDEEDGVPYHYFVYGEINGTTQRCFGDPAADSFGAAAEADTPTTTTLTPTQLINTWLAPRGEIA